MPPALAFYMYVPPTHLHASSGERSCQRARQAGRVERPELGCRAQPGASPAGHRKAVAPLTHTGTHASAGIGEIGKEAYAFIDFLEAAHMQVWQMLPLVPPGRPIPGVREDYWSPYSGQDASAGFPLLIELQVSQGMHFAVRR